MTDFIPTRILVTAGATQEAIDDVRFLGNQSSGKLGSLIALCAAIQGYECSLLHGNHSISPSKHPRLHSTPFSSTRDLWAKLDEYWPSHEILIMAAAVSDYTPRGGKVHGKLKRGDELQLPLSPTKDIVAYLAQNKRDDQSIIAFALEEPENLEKAALEKLHRKQVDAIVANPLETMNSSHIQATIYLKGGSTLAPQGVCTKASFARWFIDNLDAITSTTPCTP